MQNNISQNKEKQVDLDALKKKVEESNLTFKSGLIEAIKQKQVNKILVK